MKSNTNKKILFFLPSLRMGGGEGVSVDLMNMLVSKGYRVFLVVMEYDGIYKESLSTQVIIHDLKIKKIRQAFIKLLYFVKKEKPNSIFASSIHFNVLVIIVSIFTGFKSRVIIRIGSPFSLLFKEFKSFKDKYVLLWLTKFLYRYATRIICVADCIKKDLQTFVSVSQEKLIVLYSPKNIQRIIKKSKEDKPKIFIQKQEPYFLFVGRLTSAKDPETLLEAFNLFKQDGRKGTLLYIGDGGLHELLKDKTKKYNLTKSVFFLGAQKNPYPYMRYATSIIISSLSEGLPNVLLEALILEKPVIATDCLPGGAREIILGTTETIEDSKESQLGIVVPVRNPNKLKEALIRVTDTDFNPYLPQKFNNGYDKFIDIF